jgi:HD-GYP domain-containing protein (c-di-GMP phosphodiesterase class II)
MGAWKPGSRLSAEGEAQYRDALTVAAALAELERHSGSQFDPEISRAFVAHVLEVTAGRAA